MGHRAAYARALALGLLLLTAPAAGERDHISGAYSAGRILRPFVPRGHQSTDDDRAIASPPPRVNPGFQDFRLGTVAPSGTLAGPLYSGPQTPTFLPRKPTAEVVVRPPPPALRESTADILAEAADALTRAMKSIQRSSGDTGEVDNDERPRLSPALRAILAIATGQDPEDVDKWLANKGDGGFQSVSDMTGGKNGMAPPGAEGGSSDNVGGGPRGPKDHNNVGGGGGNNGGGNPPPQNRPPAPPPPPLGENPIITPPRPPPPPPPRNIDPRQPPPNGSGNDSGAGRPGFDWDKIKPGDPIVGDNKADLSKLPPKSESTRQYPNLIPPWYNGNPSWQYVAAISAGRGAMCSATLIYAACGICIAATASHCLDDSVKAAPDRQFDSSVQAYRGTVNMRDHFGDFQAMVFVNLAYVRGFIQDTAAFAYRCSGAGEKPVIPLATEPLRYQRGSGVPVWYGKVMPGGPGLYRGRTYVEPNVVGINGHPPGLYETQVWQDGTVVQQGDSGGGLFTGSGRGDYKLAGVLSTARPGTRLCSYSTNESMRFVSTILRSFENSVEEKKRQDPNACTF